MERLRRIHPIREALRARRRTLERLVLRVPRVRAGDELASLAEAAGVRVEEAEAPALERLVGREHQGAVLEAGPLPEQALEEVLAREADGPRRLLALDGVNDPQNLGALARTAEAAGVEGLILTRRNAPPLSPAVSHASAGAIEHLAVARVPNLVRALETAARAGFWSIGADANGGEPLFSSPDRWWEGSLVLVLGAEGAGLRPGVRDALDHRVHVPLPGKTGSLNVAAAAALLLFEPVRRASEQGGLE